MTSSELYKKLVPNSKKYFIAQRSEGGLSVNLSDMFTRFVRDAARCNSYCSDVYYDMKTIERLVNNFDPKTEYDPIWIGFRKLGVDGTDYVLSRVEEDKVYMSLAANYFALYSVVIEPRGEDWYDIVLNEYAV